jgi:hypothetical protein
VDDKLSQQGQYSRSLTLRLIFSLGSKNETEDDPTKNKNAASTGDKVIVPILQ